MFPYRDENETQRPAYVTMAIIAACVLVWLVVQGAGAQRTVDESVCNLGLIPGELTGTAPPGSGFPMGPDTVCKTEAGIHLNHILTSMFLHGSWMHLLGNMWFLWIFGNNIEDSMTRPRFIVFYLLCGLVAAMAQVFSQPNSVVPMVGASGAISGVMGAYLVLYPRVKVWCVIPLFIFFTTYALPAWVMLIYWMGLQLLGGFTQHGQGGVAFFAHVGGFLAGVLLIKLFERRDHVAQRIATQWRPARVGFGREQA